MQDHAKLSKGKLNWECVCWKLFTKGTGNFNVHIQPGKLLSCLLNKAEKTRAESAQWEIRSPDKAFWLHYFLFWVALQSTENCIPLTQIVISHFLSLVSATSPHSRAIKPRQFKQIKTQLI